RRTRISLPSLGFRLCPLLRATVLELVDISPPASVTEARRCLLLAAYSSSPARRRLLVIEEREARERLPKLKRTESSREGKRIKRVRLEGEKNRKNK
ncbi:hypothetical protein Dimus_035792, partial [Dionaea muscipula]